MQERGWQLMTPASHGAMMAIRSIDAPELVRLLGEERIVVSARDGNVRVSPHFYNNADDVDRPLEVLDRNVQLLVLS